MVIQLKDILPLMNQFMWLDISYQKKNHKGGECVAYQVKDLPEKYANAYVTYMCSAPCLDAYSPKIQKEGGVNNACLLLDLCGSVKDIVEEVV